MSTLTTAVLLEREARYVLLAPLARQKRVLDLGGESGRGLALLTEAEATTITAMSEDPARTEAAIAAAGVGGVTVCQDEGHALPFPEAAFDLIICHDLDARLAKHESLLAELRRVLDPGGVLAVALANPQGRTLGALFGEQARSALTYEALYAELAPLFGGLSAFGQSPLTASFFYDLSSEDEDPGLALDRSLLSDDDLPGWFVLLFSQSPIKREELCIVQLPFEELRAAAASATLAQTLSERQSELDAEHARAAAIEESRAELMASFDALTSEKEELSTRFDLLASERNDFAARYDALASERDELTARLEASYKERDELQRHLEARVSEQQELLTRHQALTSEREALRAELETMAAARQVITERHQALASEAEALRAELEAGAVARQALAEQHQALEQEHAALVARQNTLADEHAERVTQLQVEADNRSQNLEGELAALREKLLEAENRGQAFEARINELAAEHDASMQRVSELEAASREAEHRLDALRLVEQQAEVQSQELEILRRENEASNQVEREKLEAELTKAREIREELEEQLSAARAQNTTLAAELAALMQQLEELRETSARQNSIETTEISPDSAPPPDTQTEPASPADEDTPVFGDIEMEAKSTEKPKRAPATLDDLEDLLADSIPPIQTPES